MSFTATTVDADVTNSSKNNVMATESIQTHFDGFCIHQGFLVLLGWVAAPGVVEIKVVKEHDAESSAMDFRTLLTERPDVKQVLGLDDTAYSQGFAVFIDARDTAIEQMVLHVGEKALPCQQVQESTSIEIESLWQLFEQVSSQELDEIKDFIGYSAISTSEQEPELEQDEQTPTSMVIEENTTLSSSPVPQGHIPQGYIDYSHSNANGLVIFSGWCSDVNTLCLTVNGANFSQDIKHIMRYARPDVAVEIGVNPEALVGFIGIAHVQNQPVDTLSLHLSEERVHHSAVKSSPVPPSSGANHKVSAIQQVLNRVDIYSEDFFNQLGPQALALVQSIWQGETLLDEVSPEVKGYGDGPAKPQVSLIIPIYRRYDFVAHQIAAFAQDADMANHEIIYVLDDPLIEREFAISCHGIYQTFRHPFKTVYGGKNLGFAGANNLGASVASGDYILALNSDILPSQHGWLSRLVTQFKALDNPGLLGTRLVYEDDTIQHLGMEFADDAYYPGIWMNYHPYKGMPASLVCQNLASTLEVQSVTGACMLMERETYLELGGFDTCYVLGDFEDSDLCLKVHDSGKKIYLDTQEKLYHLERLSQNLVDSGDWKFKLTLLNGLLQKQKWQQKIEEVRGRYA